MGWCTRNNHLLFFFYLGMHAICKIGIALRTDFNSYRHRTEINYLAGRLVNVYFPMERMWPPFVTSPGGGTWSGNGYRLRSDSWRAVAVMARDG